MPIGFSFRTFVLCLLFGVPGVHAQWRGPQLTQLGPAEGLPATILDMCQDSTGYIYIASNMGLYVYDGHAFEFYGHQPLQENSIGAGELLSIIPGSDGLVWMTLRFGGLNSFDPLTQTFRRYPLPELSFRSVPTASSLFEDNDGTLWVGGSHFRLLAFDRSKEEFTTYSPPWIDPQHHGGRLDVMSIYQDVHHPELLWLSVLDYEYNDPLHLSYGLVSFNKETKAFTPFSCGGKTEFQDEKGILWGVFWGNYISRFDPQSLQCDTFQFQYPFLHQILRPRSRDIVRYQDEILVSTANAILNFTGESFQTRIFDEIRKESFTSLYVDRDHNLWIGTDQGAFVQNPDDQHIRFFSLNKFGITHRLYPAQLAYHAGQDAVYLSYSNGPLSGSIFKISLDENKTDQAQLIPSDFFVKGIACDHHQRIWAAGKDDFHLLNTVDHTLSAQRLVKPTDKPLPGIFLMRSSDEGWVASLSAHEFIWFHADSQELRRMHINQLPGDPYAKSYDNVFDGFSLCKNNRAYLFSNELHLLDLTSGRVRRLKYDPRINPHLQAFQYCGEDDKGNIWISSFVFLGQFQLRGDSLVLEHAYTIDQGMISAHAIELHPDEHGRIWAFTGSGMNCIDPITHEVRSFSTREGLPMPFIDPRQVISTADGRLMTVCHNGMISFDSEDLWNAVAYTNAKIVINRLRVDGIIRNALDADHSTEVLRLRPGNKTVDIEFQALVFPSDYHIEYCYRIAGLQEEWTSIGSNNLVTLPSLTPGTYTFEVKVGLPQSDAEVTSLLVIVPTPIHQQWWFILSGVALITLTLAWMIRSRIQRIHQKEIEQTEINKQMAELELKALRSQMNPHFMFNSLNSVKNYILHAEPKLAAEYLSNFAHLIRLILQNSREKAISLQEELETLLLYIELEQIRFDNRFEFNCVVEEGFSMEQVMIPPMLLQPYVENAIWHGLMHKKEKGHLSLRFAAEGNMIACTIEDDGVGRSKAAEMKSLSANTYKSMGMGITRDRIEIMNKMDAMGISTEVIDKTDHTGKSAGTKVIVRIPGSTPD